MATPANRSNPNCLNIGFDYDSMPAIGDLMEITSARVARKLTSVGSRTFLGPVISRSRHTGDCVVRTRFNDNNTDRVAGEQVVPGPFVFGPDNKVYQYTPGSPAVVTGTTTGVKTVVVSTSDKLKIAYDVGGADQTITLTAGVGVTMAAMAAEITDQAEGFSASVNLAGNLVLTGDDIWKPIEVKAVSNDAYTLLGLSAGITAASGPSHDPNVVAGLIVVGGAKDATIETLEY